MPAAAETPLNIVPEVFQAISPAVSNPYLGSELPSSDVTMGLNPGLGGASFSALGTCTPREMSL